MYSDDCILYSFFKQPCLILVINIEMRLYYYNSGITISGKNNERVML